MGDIHLNILKSTKQRTFKKKIFGFDIETYDNNKQFLMASIVSEDYEKVFYDKEELINEIKYNKIFKNSFLVATNLSFDFFGTFFNSDEQKQFFTLFRGSDLLYAKTYYYNGEFYPFSKPPTNSKKSLPSITFLDSMNFAKLSVAKMGKIIGIPKIETPDFIGEYPKNKEEWDIMREYNIRDSTVTYHFMKYLIKGFEDLGATFKNTLASTSMSLFKNKYLKQDYFQMKEEDLIEIFKSYYGGRTEAFSRGLIKDMNYYDINSLYPSVMEENQFPDPNSHRITYKNSNSYINEYEGCSNIEIFIPRNTKIPILPHRTEQGRVIFPTGKITGWYNHVEIRKAIEEGAVLTKVYKTHYFTKLCTPFKEYVNDLYDLRRKYQKEGNSMEYLVKIMLNSLYGKFGQRFTDRDNWTHESSISIKDLQKAHTIERKGEYIRTTKSSRPSAFCIPIWASYVTSYARLKLYSYLKDYDPIYCDTDSIITPHTIPESSQLGKMKKEMEITEGIIVRPKFYGLVGYEFKEGKKIPIEYVKIKGLGKRLTYFEFVGLLNSPIQKVEYDKFTKFKEALRRDLIPNEIIKVSKEFSLEDEKRFWRNYFNPDELQNGIPIHITGTITEKKIPIPDELSMMNLTGEDTFDYMGKDITKEEFLDNEIFFEME